MDKTGRHKDGLYDFECKAQDAMLHLIQSLHYLAGSGGICRDTKDNDSMPAGYNVRLLFGPYRAPALKLSERAFAWRVIATHQRSGAFERFRKRAKHEAYERRQKSYT